MYMLIKNHTNIILQIFEIMVTKYKNRNLPATEKADFQLNQVVWDLKQKTKQKNTRENLR
jgi:hypothetical protein